MYNVHPILIERFVETRTRELQRIAGHTRVYRERSRPRSLRRRRP